MRYRIMARILGGWRYLRFTFGRSVVFSPYGPGVPGYQGSYGVGEKCLAFLRDDDSIQFCW